MRVLPVLLGVLAVGLVAALFAIPALDSLTRECPDADALFDNGLTTDAERVYTAMLADQPDSGCGTKGMQRVVERRCAEANRLRGRVRGEPSQAASARAEAGKAYVKMLATEPPGDPADNRYKNAIACALAGLKELEALEPTPTATATPKPAVCRCKSTCTARPAPPCREKHKSWRD